MKISSALAIVSIALMVDYTVGYNLLDGLGLLQSYYGMQSAAAPAPAPVPAPAPTYDPMIYALALAPPMVSPPPPTAALPPACTCPTCAAAEQKSACSCGHPSCLSMIKPCLHAKLLNLKKKHIEKKLAHLLACCAQFNSHLASHSC